MTAKLDNAKALYQEGIQEGRAREAVERYTGARYTQHSTGVRDGVEGFVEFFEPFLERNPVRDIQLVRAIEDGRYVFVHAAQSLNNGESRWITMDMFDTDEDDRIIEHWDVITPWVDETVSGHSQVDGPTEVTDLDRAEANKEHVAAFINDVFIHGRLDRITDYISTTSYTQHNPQIPDGADSLAGFLRGMAEAGTPMVYKDIFRILSQGNFVVTYCPAQIGDEDYAAFDLFRLEDGLIVEHWDALEPLPTGEMLVNSGKF